MRYLRLSILALWLVGPNTACDTSGPKPGENGGTCRISTTPCNAGLVCRTNGCHPPNGPEALTLEAQITLRKLGEPEGQHGPFIMQADGRDFAGISVKVVDQKTQEPWVGAARLWVSPPAAGRLDRNILALDENGEGRTTFYACNGDDPTCPNRARIQVSVMDEVITPIGTSDLITLEGGNELSSNPGSGDGAGGSGDMTQPVGDRWGRPNEGCSSINTWSTTDKPEGFFLRDWKATTDGDFELELTYSVEFDPDTKKKSVNTLIGYEEGVTSYGLRPEGPTFDIEFEAISYHCDGGIVLLNLTEDAGQVIGVELSYALTCDESDGRISGCLRLSNDRNQR